MKNFKLIIWLLCICCAFLLHSAGAEDIWIEGEQPDILPPGELSSYGVSFGDAQPDLQSGGRLLGMALNHDQAKASFPPDGLVFGYHFDVREGGAYDLWMRLGFDFGRSDFQYRFDDGDWMTCENTVSSIDLMMLMKFNPLSWAKLPPVTLEPGKHTLSIRHFPFTVKDAEGNEKPSRTLHKLDVIFLTRSAFLPDGKYRPGEDYRSEMDKEAAQKLYALPETAENSAVNPAVRLDGLWEFARWDEWAVDEATRLEPPDTLPDMERLHWRAIAVPGDRNKALPEFTYAHRYILRSRVMVPASYDNHSFLLELNNFIMIAGVFVNGQFIGGSRAFDTIWNCDLGKAIVPGQVNEIAVVIKDIYYARDPEKMNDRAAELYGTRSGFSAPIDMSFHQSLGGSFDMPVSWGHGGTGRTGLIETVRLIARGPQYVADVFPMPSVSEERLQLEITLANPREQDKEVEALSRVVRWQKGQDAATALQTGAIVPALSFPLHKVKIPAGASTSFTLSQDWKDAELWWPDDPKLYVVVTELRSGDQIIDTQTSRFGFREWGWKDNAYFSLNGVPWQFWAVHSSGNIGGDKDVYAFVEHCRRTGTNMLRYIHWANDWARRSGMTTSEILDVLDEEGIAVRFNGAIDGQVANYGLNLTAGSRDDRTANWDLWNNVIDQGLAWVRSYRNHPSMMIWGLDNEVSYINANNLGQGPWVDPVFREFGEKVMRLDPTRPTMVDGGNALRPPEEWKTTDEIRALGPLPVNGAHYIEEHNVDKRDYPDAAYTNLHWAESPQRGAFPILLDRPIYHGEIFFAGGHGTDRMATIGGEQCFIGAAYTHHARALYVRMMTEGFRWGLTSGAWDMGLSQLDDDYIVSFQPVVLFCREWNSTLEVGETTERTLMAINQSSSSEPLLAKWELVHDGQIYHTASRNLNLAPGERSVLAVEIQAPKTPVEEGAFWVLSMERNGQRVFEDKRPVRIIDTSVKKIDSEKKATVYLFDPRNVLADRLAARDYQVMQVESIEQLPEGPNFIVIGPDAVPQEQADAPLWQRLALSGAKILVLEQDFPLYHQALPADLERSDFSGRIAFAENPGHPVFSGLRSQDLHFWAALQDRGEDLERGSYDWSERVRTNVVYKNAYRKANRGARSLAQCDEALAYSALSECPAGEGVILLSQFLIGEKMQSEPAARRLFDNLVDYTSAYELLRRKTIVVMEDAHPALKLLQEQNAQFERADDPVSAIDNGAGIVIVEANARNMQLLASAKEKTRDFMNNGGWIVPWGVTPESIDALNALVGVEHLLRPFTQERVVLATPRDTLSAGLSLRDVVMESGEKIVTHLATRWGSEDVFSYVVSLDDIAPFSKIDGHGPMARGPRSPHIRNIVNGFTNKEFWRYIYYMEKEKDMDNRITLELPGKERVKGLSIILNTSYKIPQKMMVYFSPDASASVAPLTIPLETDDSVQHFEIPSPVETDYLRLEFSDLADTSPRDIIGVDNLWVTVERSPEFQQRVHPLLNIGGLVRYAFGEGGLFLNQLLIQDAESNPVNREKKAAIVKTTLGNLGVPFGGSSIIVAGKSLDYSPVVIRDEQYNAFLDHEREPIWFRDSAFPTATLANLPDGEQRLADILFRINNFFTSPVTSAVMLAGEGSQVKEESVAGMAVGRKAQALFFLHAYQPTRNLERWSPDPRKGETEPPDLFVYRIHYADGMIEEVPVRWRRDIDDWLREDPASLPTAYLAWVSTVEGAEKMRKALYAFQWNNPRVDVAIESVEMALGDSQRKQWGAPALLAITVANSPRDANQ